MFQVFSLYCFDKRVLHFSFCNCYVVFLMLSYFLRFLLKVKSSDDVSLTFMATIGKFAISLSNARFLGSPLL